MAYTETRPRRVGRLSSKEPQILLKAKVPDRGCQPKWKVSRRPRPLEIPTFRLRNSILAERRIQPIPRSKSDIAMAHAMAGQCLGMKFIYLEAGSGALNSVPEQMIRDVSNYIDIPLIVGGGLTTSDDCRRVVEAGASFVVVGNHFETNNNLNHLRELTSTVHHKESLTV